ncbi:alpha-1,2-fucosyltransferase [Tamlana sp. 2_MG-2023]|uniref:alpha-1,2-fucosyltransferase n=1 Tax=unclassified Tamlana TaxID=2614803 RepID=UPI0026E1F25A|nr:MULTISPECIES: alpha-1,2-fucosyltransferase [unclassified Tamlana]MDO6758755.1 alpha-1,2-fucosyltransferase [Tamlana sp. 2_MG-2023]MDO6789454.1 alpha-1,2-fucosyltransferase [Tamlana sp. 1_MG-2023]
MIIYSRLGNKGNFGNQLFQIASTISIATKNGHAFAFPKWKYASCFKFDFNLYDPHRNYQTVKEQGYYYSDIVVKDGNYDLNGWFQSEKYFDIEVVKNCLKIQPEIIKKVKEKYNKVLSKKNILISVRRGDFVNHPYYYQLDYKYYFLGITKNFKDWKERILIFTSDDIAYCKKHFDFLPNAIFVENSTVIEQLALGSLCDDFVISNSTFSWWLAWLGEKEEKRVVRPVQNFRGKFRIQNDDKDYYPERWEVFNAEKEKIKLKYWSLICKGELGKTQDSIKYFQKVSVKKTKKNN